MLRIPKQTTGPLGRPVGTSIRVWPAGTPVRVNHYLGQVIRVWTEVGGHDALTGQFIGSRLRNPLYDIEIDLSRRVGWARGCRQVYIEPGRTQLRLFADEFEVLGRPSVRAESRPPLRWPSSI